MSKRYQEKVQRERIRREIDQLRATLDGHRPLDQEQRAELARIAHQLLGEAHRVGGRDASKEVLKLFERTLAIAYPGGFWESYDRLKAGDPAGLDIAIGFLEDDPWFFRSGYIKEHLLTFIKRIDIPERYLPRLERVLLAAVDGRDRHEFRQYCHLAREIGSANLRHELSTRLHDDNPGIQRRSSWMLEAMEQGPRFR